jgi:hypothetical protein
MENNDKYITLNGLKGIFTLQEVIDLLHNNGLKVKIVMSKNGDSYEVNSEDLHTSDERR